MNDILINYTIDFNYTLIIDDNDEYFMKDYWLSQFASTWTIDSLYLFINTPLGMVGCILNTLSLIILFKKEFQDMKLYSYLRIYSFNSLVSNLFETFLFVTATFRYFEFSNSYGAAFYGCYLYLPIVNTCFFYGSFLDIWINLERISIFRKGVKYWLKYSPLQIGLVLFVFAVLIASPFFFANEPAFYDATLSLTSSFRIFFWGKTKFSQTLAGKVLIGMAYFMRDIFTSFLEISINLISIYLLQKYLNEKGKTNKRKFVSNIQVGNDEGNLMLSNSLRAMNRSRMTIFRFEISKMDKNVTMMVIILCSISIFVHIISLMSSGLNFYTYNTTTVAISALTAISVTFKNFSNFILFYLFNFNFRKNFRRLFKFLF